MSILFVMITGAMVGWVGGQSMKRGEYSIILDIAVGAIGAMAGAILLRMFGPSAANGVMGSIAVSAVAATALLFGMRRVLRPAPAAATRGRRM